MIWIARNIRKANCKSKVSKTTPRIQMVFFCDVFRQLGLRAIEKREGMTHLCCSQFAWNVLKMWHINPKWKDGILQTSLVVALNKFKGPTRKVEGGHHLWNRPPANYPHTYFDIHIVNLHNIWDMCGHNQFYLRPNTKKALPNTAIYNKMQGCQRTWFYMTFITATIPDVPLFSGHIRDFINITTRRLNGKYREVSKPALIARFMGPTWDPSGADRTQVGPLLAPWTLLSGAEDMSVAFYVIGTSAQVLSMHLSNSSSIR